MRPIRDTNLLCVHLAMVMAMLVWVLRAMFFSGAYSEHSELPAHWHLVIDASRPERMLTIFAGFLAPLFGVPLLMALREWGDRQHPVLAHTCLQIAMVALGWYGFPYFGLGVTHAYAQQERLTAYDPMQNPPGMLPLAGDLWYLSALVAPAALVLVGACMAIAVAVTWKGAGRLARTAMAAGTAVCLLLPFTMPYYFEWIFD